MAKRIMFQGTGSTVGKSLTVAAMCRILKDMGYTVAPFKSQNMALNSFITKEGKEMGRAQVVQAEAARIEPHVYMNPILLKPTSYVGSQVILNGEVYRNMKAAEYFTQKDFLIPHIKTAFNALNTQYDVIVIEGAGSPAEINLRSRDIVNMGLAEMVDTDVILIGDVDKGGVFASLYGTVKLLSESEQKRIKGFLINKFRGDVSLLMPGVEMLEEKIGIPCVGVIPYIEKLKIDDEDSVTERFGKKRDAALTIGVVKLPYMSNFSDFTVFDMEDDVNLIYVDDVEVLDTCDALIIPGSKNTIFDMLSLRKSGVDEGIKAFHQKGKPIIGICGGYQILGKQISDPYEVESVDPTIDGLGLLDVITEMAKEKKTVQNEGVIVNGIETYKALKVGGYEIHMGESKRINEQTAPFIKTVDGHEDGAVNAAMTVFGTYFHGIFDNDAFRRAFINKLRQQNGLAPLADSVDFAAAKNAEYDRLAKHVRDNLNMDRMMQILEESRTNAC
ncbi:MAG: adenosylcobyric acid synthase [Clostridiales bacterium]|nr:adenosylcobyric acid synthase [Clostridiales bacterium]